jgi:AcrR family transcriptional regulator
MANRRADRVDEQYQEKRNRILKAVRQVVKEVGLRDTQVAMVAEVAGVATGTVYRYFHSKGELFAEALATNAQHEVDVIAAIAGADGAAASRLADAIGVFARRAMQTRRLAWATIAEPADPEVDAIRIAYRRTFAEIFEKLIAEGMRHGEFPHQKAATSAACVMGALNESLSISLAPEAPELSDTSTLIDAIIAFSMQALTARAYPPLRLVLNKS